MLKTIPNHLITLDSLKMVITTKEASKKQECFKGFYLARMLGNAKR